MDLKGSLRRPVSQPAYRTSLPDHDVFFEAFCFAQRFRCASAIFARAAAEIVRFLRGALGVSKAVFGGRPLRFLVGVESITVRAARAR